MADEEINSQCRTKERWRVKKEVSLPDILSFVAACVAIVVAWTTLDKRLTVVEASVVRQEDDGVRRQTRIDFQLDKLSEKLDRLIERR